MSGSQIATNVTLTVTLGNAPYPSPLTITASGMVAPDAYGAIGVVGTAAAGLSLDNLGVIAGALGGKYGFSGIGGTGLVLGDGSASNAGRIGGGTGTLGGLGVALEADGTLFNTATGAIAGGTSGGGSLYDSGGVGVAVAAGATLVNAGMVAGGTGATGQPAGFVGKGGTGGAGVTTTGLGAMITNTDLIIGGAGGGGDDAYAGNGGTGATLAGGTFVNEGTVQGGGGGYGGSGNGGTGLTAGAGVSVDNAGTILGGNGAPGSFSPYENVSFGGAGGTGLSLTGATFLNSGFIGGGNGANNPAYPGAAGSGVALDGGILFADGTIAGGLAGALGNNVGTVVGDAVSVTAGTLVVMPGVVFDGTVSAVGAKAAELVFPAGTTAVPLAGLGTAFTGFTTIDLEANPGLSLAGSYATGALLILGDQAILDSAATLTGGVELGTTASLQSTGRIVGTTAVYGECTVDQNGGAGITLAASAQVVNSGLIAGGVGGRESNGYDGRYGGAGVAPDGGIAAVLAAGASLTNDGTLVGGAAGFFSVSGQGGTAGQAAVLASGAVLVNQGTLIGGMAGASTEAVAAAGVVADESTLANSGTIFGGSGFGSSTVPGGAAGAAGVALTGGSLANTGLIGGGSGGGGGYATTVVGGAGGSAVAATGGVIANGGTLLGGAAAYDGPGAAGVALSGATLTNTALIGGGSGGEANGAEIGGTGGVGAALAGATLINDGTIAGGVGGFANGTLASGGAGGAGLIAAGGVVISGGTVLGAQGGFGASGTDGGAGAALSAGATLTNSGLIRGGGGGIGQTGQSGAGGIGVMVTGATLVNSGTIFGSSAGGNVSAGLAGTIGAAIVLTGGLVSNYGSVIGVEAYGRAGGIGVMLDGGTLVDAGTIVAGTGLIGTEASYTKALSDAVLFGTAGGTLVLEPGAVLAGTIGGFAGNDTIDLAGFAAQTSSFNNGILTLTDSQGSMVTLDLSSATSLAQFALTPDGADGTDITTAPCYAVGTHIATVRGLVAVEHLAAGDHVCLARGGTAPIRWLGHRRVNCAAHADPDAVLPVRIRAHAFAPDLPGRDLWLSPDHAVFAEDVLIPVKHLVNGRSIAQVAVRAIEYWHVELDRHDVLLAEGLPAESYLDTGNRLAFANQPAVALHPDFSARSWDDACAELAQEGSRVVDLKRRLFVRAGGVPAPPGAALSIRVGQRVLVPGIGADGRWRCGLPPGTRVLHLDAAPWMPAACVADSLDRRWIGARLFSIVIDGEPLALTDPALTGFHPPEATAEGPCRWTSAKAQIALPAGARTVTLHVGDAATGSAVASAPVRRRRAAMKAASVGGICRRDG